MPPWWQSLTEAGCRQEVAHAYLFTGPSGLGQEEVARRLAMTLNCRASQTERPCGDCGDCRRTAEGVHPEVRVTAPAGGSFRLDQVRDMLRDLSLSATGGRWRVYVMQDSHRMTMEAANRLLKILEEPPPRSVLILLAESPGSLPDTIVSRCQVMPFRRLPEDGLVEILAAETDLPALTLRSTARLAGGNPTVARRLVELGAVGDLRETVLAAAEGLARGEPQDILGAAVALEQTGDGWEDALRVLDAFWRDVRMYQAGLDPADFYHCDLGERIAALAVDLAPVDVEGLLRVSCGLRRSLEVKAARPLAFEVACLRLAGILAGRPGADLPTGWAASR